MLDDLKYIHHKDSSDALGVAEKQWEQYTHDFGFKTTFSGSIQNLVIAGMGGSGLAAKTLYSWPGVSVPMMVVQDYELPSYVNDKTLLICSSYSGNTEEVLAVLKQALGLSLKPQIIVVDSGGDLLDEAKANDVPHIELPKHLQPRMSFGYQYRALIEILEQANLVKGAISQLAPAAEWLQKEIAQWLPTIPTSKNSVKQLALELVGKASVIYAGPKLSSAAYKWKISFNENAKNIAWWNQLPEFNHNEILGWTSHPRHKPYAVIDLRSDLENPQVQKRFEITERLLSGQRPTPHIINAAGDSILKQLMWTIALGDFVSLYLALLNGLDPTPVDLLQKLKKSLAE